MTEPGATESKRRKPTGRARIPQFRGPVLYTVEPRPGDGTDDEANTAQTIARMVEYTTTDSQAPAIREAALTATAGTNDADQAARAIHAWIRSHVAYADDNQYVNGIVPAAQFVQVLIRPVDLLGMPRPAAKCASFSMLTAAMLRAVGIESEFRTIAADPESPELYSHVYVIAYVPAPLAIDASHGPRPGWEAPLAGKSRNWSIERRSGVLGSVDWGEFAAGALQTAEQGAVNILGTRYSVPQIEPGQTYQTRSGYITDTGGVPLSLGTGGISGSTLLLLAVAAVALLFAFSARNQ